MRLGRLLKWDPTKEEFIDDKEAKLLVNLSRDARFGFDHTRGREQNVFEVELATLVFEPLVRVLQVDHAVDRECLRQRAALRRILVDRQAGGLAPLDLCRGIPQRSRVEFEP